MNEQRTFGVELETHCKVERDVLARRLNDEVLAQFGHNAYAEGYQHSVNVHNRRTWSVKPDGSLRPSPVTGYPVDAEIVTPVLQGSEGLNILRKVCEWLVASDLVRVSVKCGLHVHHGVVASEVVPLLRSWLKVENVIMESLPGSRKFNYYCQRLGLVDGYYGSYGGFGVRPPSTGQSLSTWLSSNTRNSRYCTLNMESFRLRSTAEIRCAAASYEPEKIINWVLFTQAVVDSSANEPIATLRTVEDVIGWITRPVTTRIERHETVASALRAHPKGKGYMNHKRGSMADMIDRLVTEGTTLSNAIAQLELVHHRSYDQARTKFLGHIAYLRAQGLNIHQERRGADRWYKVMPVNVDQVVVVEQHDAPTADADFVAAADWFRARHARFVNAQPPRPRY